jgi:hypothetical protein
VLKVTQILLAEPGPFRTLPLGQAKALAQAHKILADQSADIHCAHINWRRAMPRASALSDGAVALIGESNDVPTSSQQSFEPDLQKWH